MNLKAQKPILYLITRGATTADTGPASKEFHDLLALVRAAVTAGIDLIQLREKQLTARVLFELTQQAVEITRGSDTALLVNDRADIARAAGAEGVHLAANSLAAQLVRRTFGPNFLIGVSTHIQLELQNAQEAGADFAVFGPVFETSSKLQYGAPLGLNELQEAAAVVAPFPVIAIGGITFTNATECLRAGAAGVAAIGLFSEASSLAARVDAIRRGDQEADSRSRRQEQDAGITEES
jgi:thiamine-phosphate pyrophosphorylase